MHAEVAQRGLDLVEHQRDALGPEDLQGGGVVEAGQLGPARDDRLRDLGDVRPGVAVLRRRLALGGGEQRLGEAVDLGAGVVEVVLGADLGAGGAQQPAQRVADGGPADAADVHRAGRVRRDELQVDLLPGERRRCGRTAAPAATMSWASCPAAAASSRMLRKPGPAISTDLIPGVRVSVSASAVANSRGGTPSLLAHLQRDRRGVVAVLGVAGSLHRRGGGQHGGVEPAVGEDGVGSGKDGLGELCRSHRIMLSAGPERFSACMTQAP